MNLPTNWKDVELKNYFSRLTRKNNERNTNVLTISAQHGLISQQEFFNKSIASEDKSNYFLLERGDFAYNKSYSAGYPFGAVKSLEKYDKGIVSPLYICFKKTTENKCPDYFLQYFEAGLANKEICSVAQEGARNHGLLNISTEDFFKIKIVVPPLAEQLKIAEILCKQDKIISLKQKLLEQKQQQKKWLMQKLLEVSHTNADCEGNFPLGGVMIDKSGWKKERIKDVSTKIIAGATPSTKIKDFWNGNISWMSSGEINKRIIFETEIKISQLGYESCSTKIVPPKSVLIALAGQGKTRGMVAVNEIALCTNQSLASVIPKNIDYKFLFYFLDSKYSDLRMISSGDGSRGGLNLEIISNYEIYLPTLPEQKIIAQVLSTADKEIALLKSSIEQEKQKKKSLAQLLLTGTVRVKI